MIRVVTGAIWVTDREPGIRDLFGELIAEAEVLEHYISEELELLMAA